MLSQGWLKVPWYLSRIVLPEVTARRGRILAVHNTFAPSPHLDSLSPYLYSQKRKVIDYHVSDFWQKSPWVPRLLQQFRAEIQKERNCRAHLVPVCVCLAVSL